MIMYSCQPDKNSIYAVGYMEGELPPERRNLPPETLLNDACDGSIRNTENQGAVESGRESIQLGPYPGKQLSSDIARAGAKTVARVYLAHGKIFIVMAGAVGLEKDHANVKRLFESFEILETGVTAPSPPKTEIARVQPSDACADHTATFAERCDRHESAPPSTG